MRLNLLFAKVIMLSLYSLLLSNVSYGQTNLGNFSYISEMVAVGNNLFFSASDEKNVQRLWVTQGSKYSNTILDPDKSITASKLTAFNGALWFSGYDMINGTELWKSDGTPEGTKLVKNIMNNSDRYTKDSNPSNFITFNGELYFTAEDSFFELDIWKTDGTTAGTVKVYEAARNSISQLTATEKKMFFVSSGKLMQLDAQSGNVTEVVTRDDDRYTIAELTAFGADLLFITHTMHRKEIRLYIYKSETNTVTLLKEYKTSQYGDQGINNFTLVGENIFYSVWTSPDSETDTDTLWKTDGTEAGTVEVKTFDWESNVSGSYMRNFIAFKGLLYFGASGTENNNLYKSDGSTEGTEMVYNISVNEKIKPIATPDKIILSGYVGKVWETDGTTEGTQQLFDEIALETYLIPSVFVAIGNEVFFSTNTKNDQRQLWSTKPNTLVEIRQDYRVLDNGKVLKCESKIDNIANYRFVIKNNGNKELSTSKVTVTGSSFYLSGDLKPYLLPNETDTFMLHFLPTQESHTSLLEIITNDENDGHFTVKLDGTTNDQANQATADVFASIEFRSALFSTQEISKFTLDNVVLTENLPIGSLVGNFSVEGASNITYKFIAGNGDRDNQMFSITDNKLSSARFFDFEIQPTYNVRVEALDQSTQTKYEKSFIIRIENANEKVEFDQCKRTPRNVMYALLDVAFVSETLVFAVGRNGNILKSEDAGTTWTQVNKNGQTDLSTIQFTDENTGYILGGSEMYKTENTGRDWFVLEFPDPEYTGYSSMFFVNNDIGFVVGENGKILKTTDGGKTWVSKQEGHNDFNATYFFNENVGFICGRNVLKKTSNSGELWEDIDISFLNWDIKLVDIQFVSSEVGFMLDRDGNVYKTSDKGLSWTKVGDFPTDSATDIHFLDEQTGYTVGNSSGSTFYKTTDSGITWNKVQEFDYDYNVLSIDFSPSKQHACAVGAGSTLYVTSQSGRSILNLKDGVWQVRSALFTSPFKTICYASEKVIYVFGGRRNFKSTDGGVTWQILPLTTEDNITEAHFFNETKGLLLAQQSIFRTFDGGETWEEQETANNYSYGPRSLYFFDDKLGFMFSGYDRYLYRTIDGGINWVQIGDKSFDFGSMHFFDEKNGFATKFQDGIFKTTDGGLTWSKVYDPTFGVYGIHFFDANHGIVSGNKEKMLMTDDGGTTWTEHEIGMDVSFKKAYFYNETSGYVIAGLTTSTSLLHTNDRGKTWDLKPSINVTGIDGFNGKIIYVGDYGTVESIEDKKEPALPSYITGNVNVAQNSTTIYTTPSVYDTYYKWEVAGSQSLNYNENDAKVKWDNTGAFELKVTPYNSCGIGKTRSISVNVEQLPTPSITGNTTVNTNKTEAYTATYTENSKLDWNVIGTTSHQVNDGAIDITWAEVGSGKIELIETRPESGARAYASLDVTIVKGPITSTELAELFTDYKVFPNPTQDFIQVTTSETSSRPIQLSLYTISGKKLKAEKFHATQALFFDIREVPAGLYLLELSNGELTQTVKVLKK